MRGSEYYRGPEKAMSRVMSELAEFEIMPETNSIEQAESATTDLLERVKIKANQITDDLSLLKEQNKNILEKCKAALINNGIMQKVIDEIISNERFIPQKHQLELV